LLTIKEAKEYCKEHSIRGLDIRGERSIRALVRVKGELYRVKLVGVDTSLKGLLKASGELGELKTLAKYNPQEFIDTYSVNTKKHKIKKKLSEYIAHFLLIKESKLAPSSYLNYLKKVTRYIKPKFGDSYVQDLKPLNIQVWLSQDLNHLSNKTIKDLVCFLNQIFVLAVVDDEIDFNPMDKLRQSNNLKFSCVKPEPQPFSINEIDKIVSTPSFRTSEINMFHFNCYAGLRICELMALAWSDIDFDKNEINVNRAVVNNEYKQPKNLASKRVVQLLPQARAVLLKQQKLMTCKAVEVDVLNEDYRTKFQNKLSFVFF